MKVSLKWLKTYIDVPTSAQELEKILPALGHEVDAIETTGIPLLNKVVVGEVLTRDQHPGADRLTFCKVRVGSTDSDILEIVCGAKNHKAGDRVVVALIGAVLPGNFKIEKSKIRGVVSHGMMCSAKELGLNQDSDGIIILENRPEIGTPINQVFTDGDTVFDLALTANRGDCASHLGIARELAAHFKLALNLPKVPTYKLSSNTNSNSAIKNLQISSKNCPFYSAWVIKGVKIGPSPDWLKNSIESIGLRSINNIVDITNFIMMDSGQPLHAFDLAKIKGHKLNIRQAKHGETITTLDNKKRTLDESMLVIADESHPLVIAGIMGSLDAEVDNSTQDIVLESAYFNPANIRATARKLGLNTDSSYRFVRNVDPLNIIPAAESAIPIILKLAGGELVQPGISQGAIPHTEHHISLKPDFIRERLGFDVADDLILETLKALNFKIDASPVHSWQITTPSFRPDVERPIDLVEEFIRVYGTDKIPATRVTLQTLHRKDDYLVECNRQVSDYLVNQSFDECYHYSLRSEKETVDLFGADQAKALVLDNPLSQDYSHLRISLIPGLIDALQYNHQHKNPATRFFEIGRVFHPSANKLSEVHSIAFVITTESPARTWLKRETSDFYTAKNLITQIAKLANINTEKLNFEYISQPHLWQEGHSAFAGSLETMSFRLNVGLLNLKYTFAHDISAPILCGEFLILPELLKKRKPASRFKSFSSFPASFKDIAIIVDASLPVENLRQEVLKISNEVVAQKFSVHNVSLFDVYQGKGLDANKKSIALSIEFRAEDRTLTDQEVMTAFTAIQEKLGKNPSYSIRN